MVEITSGRLAAAAQSLMHAGQWARASELLDAAAPADASERAVLAVAAAEVCVDRDFWCLTASADAALSRASEAVAEAATGEDTLSWDLDLQCLRHDYFAELLSPDGPQFGPEGRAPAVIEDLAARAWRLRDLAPDGGRTATATFYAGLVEDNLRGDGVAGEALFAEALTAAEEAGAELTVSEALRHLGYWASQHGDLELAREQWERSTRLRQRAGAVPYVLSQYLLLAEAARDAGDVARARTLASEVHPWALALGVGLLAAQAEDLA
jgi:GNAT superfamily N-acetyltransferase